MSHSDTHLPIVGTNSPLGQPVADIFYVYNTLGYPLDVVVQLLIEQDHAVAWDSFWDQAMARHWNPYTTLAKMEAAVLEIYGPVYAAEWLVHFKRWLVRVKQDGC